MAFIRVGGYILLVNRAPAAWGTPTAPSKGNMRMNPDASPSPRREFLKAAAATGILVAKPETVFGSQANSTVEVGLVGCGGRGNWIAPFFPEFAGARIVAVAEVIKDRLDSTRDKFKVETSRAYYGPEAYKELAHSKLDAVILETPPIFRPQHADEAVKAGKHVYLAKPVAVDVPGCKSILETEKAARAKKLTTRAGPERRTSFHQSSHDARLAFGRVFGVRVCP